MKEQFYLISDKGIKVLAERITENLKKELGPPANETRLQDTFLDVSQLTDLLDLASQTIYGLVHRRKIPYHKRNKKLYFIKDEIIDWVKSGKKEQVSVSDKVDDFLSKKRKSYKK
jgi:predicted DNA-binding transcriptional regulator AlpA